MLAKIIFIEQYINEYAGDFFLKYLVEEPLAYYKKVFSLMAAANKIKEADYTYVAEGKYDKKMIQKMIQKMARHVDFIFKHVQIL